MLGEFVFQVLDVFDDLIIRPFTCREILDEWEKLHDKHGGKVLSRGLRDQVLRKRIGE